MAAQKRDSGSPRGLSAGALSRASLHGLGVQCHKVRKIDDRNLKTTLSAINARPSLKLRFNRNQDHFRDFFQPGAAAASVESRKGLRI
jgi:hypothetical protein